MGSGFSRTDPESRAAALRLPAFPGKDTVLDRPDGQSPGFETVRPGTYPFVDPITAQPFEVVWWDPLLLDRPGEERRGLRREDLITKDADPALVAGDRARYDAWRAWKASAVARGSVPSLAVVTVSEWAESGDARFDARAAAVEVASARVSAIAPELAPIAAGRRFGILVHAVLAAVPLDAAAEDVAAMALLQARLLGASDEERAAAAAAAGRALAHPLLAQARGATAAGRVCRREVPVSLALDAAIVDGQADLLFDAGDRWMVVDFKTDVDLSAGEAAYRRQVALYVEAVSRATGRAAAGALLRI